MSSNFVNCISFLRLLCQSFIHCIPYIYMPSYNFGYD